MDRNMDATAMLLDGLNTREREILERLSAGLTDQQIAAELFLSLNTVKWYNRQIYSKLGARSRTQAIAHAQALGLLGGDAGNYDGKGDTKRDAMAPAQVPTVHVALPHLPAQTTAFIGRAHQLAEVTQLLEKSRLLTLTGPGGAGKTRLALQVAAHVAETFAQGAYFVDLAPLTDPTLVASAIARSLGILENPAEPLALTLQSALAKRDLLVVIDNFEHVIEAAPLVSELLSASVALKLLVTSREPLRLTGEQQYPVPPMSLPAAAAITARSLAESEAGALFCQRARLSSPHFDVTDDNAEAIAHICARLDGLPLAIELAAARCKLLPVHVLAERLDASTNAPALDTLSRGPRDAPQRQQTLRDAVAWSGALLNEDERKLFARLAVFKGGRSLDTIEVVCGEGLTSSVFDVLTSLVDKNLVQQKPASNGDMRFGMLGVISAYAYEQLEASGEAAWVHQRHAYYFVELAERVEPQLTAPDMWQWMDRLDAEFNNIRAAVHWCCAHDTGAGLRLVGSIQRFCVFRSHRREAHAWLEDLLKDSDNGASDQSAQSITLEERARGTRADGVLCYRLHLYDRAIDRLTESLRLFTLLEDTENIALVLGNLGNVASDQGHYVEAERYHRQGLALSRPINFAWSIASCLNNLGIALRFQGRLDEAIACFTQSAECYRKMGDPTSAASVTNNMTHVFFDLGDYEKAHRLYEESYAAMAAHDDKWRLAYAAAGLGDVAHAQGKIRLAKQHYCESIHLFFASQNGRDARMRLWQLAALEWSGGQWPAERLVMLLSMSEAFVEATHTALEPREKITFDQVLAAARAALSAKAFDAAWSRGQQLSLEEAVAFVDV